MVRRARSVVFSVVALLVVLLQLAPLAMAVVVDASENNDDLPATFDYELLTEEGGYPPKAGYETQLQQQADLRWSECLNEIDYARDGAGTLGVGGWIYVGDDGKCHTPQPGRTFEQMFDKTYRSIDNIDTDALMKELANHFDFVQWSTQDPDDVDEEAMEKAEQELANDIASNAAKDAGAGPLGSFAAGQAARAAVSAGATTEQVAAVTNPNGTLDQLTNKLKEDSGKAITEGLGYLSEGLAFDAASSTFRDVYAAAAGVGLVVLAAGAVWSFARMHKLGLPPEEAVERVLAGLVCGFFGLLFTPALLYVCTDVSNALTDGVVSWMGTTSETITGSLIDPFNALTTANSPLGYLGAIIICILFFIAGLMLIVTFAAQYLAAWFGSVGLGVTWGLVATEKGRRRHKMAATAVVMTIFARPILMFMVGGALVLSGQNTASADGWSTDPMGTLFKLIIGLGAILMVCFAPAGLLRFMPVGPSRGGGMARGFTAGLAGGAMGAGMAGSMFGSRMRSLSPMIRSAAGRAGRRISGQGGRSKPQQSKTRSAAQQAPGKQGDAGKRGTGAAGGKGRGNAEAAQGRGRHAAQPSSRGTGAQQASRRPVQSGQQPGSRSGSTGGPVEAPAGPAASGGGYQPDGLNSAPDTSGTRRDASPAPAVQPASDRSEPSRVNRDRPGARLSGADLLRSVSPARRLAGGAVRVAGRVGGAAATAAGVAAGAAATAARIGGYQAANWANNVTEEDR